jgi:predicted Zn-dependent protease with MMP-like domain
MKSVHFNDQPNTNVSPNDVSPELISQVIRAMQQVPNQPVNNPKPPKKSWKKALLIFALIVIGAGGALLYKPVKNEVNRLKQETSKPEVKTKTGSVAGVSTKHSEIPKEKMATTIVSGIDRESLDKNIYGIPTNLHPRGLNILFISHDFTDKKEFLSTAQFLMDAFQTIEPWKSYKDFNFFTIFTGPDKTMCFIQVENEPKPKLRCSEHVNDYITKLGLYKFKAVVVSRDEFTSWANVTRFDNSMVAISAPPSAANQELTRKIMLHEFAHGFGLRDEMVKSVIAKAGSEATLAGPPNCAPDIATAKEWWGDELKYISDNIATVDPAKGEVGFFVGCAGSDQYIKPTIGSLMNLDDATVNSDNYGLVSEHYLKKVLKYCFSPDTGTSVKDDQKFFELYPEFTECVNR